MLLHNDGTTTGLCMDRGNADDGLTVIGSVLLMPL